VHSKYNYAYDLNQDKRFDKTKDELALLIYFLFDHLVHRDVCRSSHFEFACVRDSSFVKIHFEKDYTGWSILRSRSCGSIVTFYSMYNRNIEWNRAYDSTYIHNGRSLHVCIY
jgi:hypothetical protein